MAGRNIWDSYVPVSWRIALHKSDLAPVTKQVARALSRSDNQLDTAAEELPERQWTWTKYPQVSLLYIGSQTVQMAAASNGLFPEEFQNKHKALEKLQGQEVCFCLDGIVGNDRFVVARAQLPDSVPCAQIPACMVLGLGLGMTPSHATDLFLAAERLQRLEPPITLHGTIQLVNAEARSPVQQYYALAWEDDLLGILQTETDMLSWCQQSADGRVNALTHSSLIGKGIFHLQILSGSCGTYYRDQVLRMCAERWPLDGSVLQALTVKGTEDSRVLTEAGIFLKGSQVLRQHIFALGRATRRFTPFPTLERHLLELLAMAEAFSTVIASLDERQHRCNLRLLLCSLRKHEHSVYRVQHVWQLIAYMLRLGSAPACTCQNLQAQLKARAERALEEARERQHCKEAES